MKARWGTRFGFYLVAIGSSFGLGNLWRFPYVVVENGGGAFVLLYIPLVFIIGLPLLIGELLLGKHTRRSVISAVNRLKTTRTMREAPLILSYSSFLTYITPYAGKLSLVICVLVLSYFSVISGWLMYYIFYFFVVRMGYTTLTPEGAWYILSQSSWIQVTLAFLHLAIVIVIVAKDIEEGIERWLGYMAPVFVILLGALITKALSLDTSVDALRFFLYPDFSRLTWSSLGNATGHVLFTLSVGFGTMITFGSYLKEKAYIPIAGFRVALLDTLISIFAGFLIFPLLFAGSLPISGPELLFKTVPELMPTITQGDLFGIGFFLCLYLSTLGASIGLLETVVSNLSGYYRIKRNKAALWAGVICLFFAFLSSLSYTTLKKVKLSGMSFIQLLDTVLINWMLPIAALVVCQLVRYLMDENIKKQQFISEQIVRSDKVYAHWSFVLKWLAPGLIISGLLLQVYDLLK